MERFFDWSVARGASAGTIKIRRSHLYRFAAGVNPLTATPDDVVAFMATRRALAPESRKSLVSSLRTFYGWALAAGLVTSDPTAILGSIRVPPTAVQPTPRAAITEALDVADEITRAAIMLGWRAGLRIGEITTLNEKCVTDLGLFITGKGGRSRLVPIHTDLVPYLRFDGWRFPSPRWPDRHAHVDWVRDRITEVTGDKPHGLRHRFATDFHEQHGDLRALQILLGHSSLQTTQRYVAVADSRLASLVNSLR